MREYIFYAALAIIFFAFIGYLFYESFIAAIIFGAAGLFYPKIQKKTLLEKRKEKLKLQFKEAIASLSSSLAAGRSIENSFKEVVSIYIFYIQIQKQKLFRSSRLLIGELKMERQSRMQF